MATDTKTRAQRYKVVGKRPIRHDGLDKVTGAARYGADIHLPGLLYGKVLRSSHAHARIKSIDTRRAEAHPDVRGVITSRDLIAGAAQHKILAQHKVLYRGYPVAAVAAANPHIAEEGLALIDVEYEELPAVTDAEDAMKDDAPILDDKLNTADVLGDDAPNKQTNISNHIQYKLGDVDRGFEEADLVLEREYRTKTVHQGYIEPHSATASWGKNGMLTVWTCSQGHFGTRQSLSGVLDIPISNVNVVPMEIGGGFGGKHRIYLEPLAALLSKKTGAPVKMTMTRAEVLEATGPTSGSYQKIKIGVTKEGRITAAQAYMAYESGAFPGASLGGAAACMFSAYDLENVLIDGYGVLDNKPPTSAYRAPGAPIGTFAVESLIGEICEELRIDPVEFRLLNAAREGTRRVTGVVNPPIGAIEVMEAIKDHPHYSTPLEGDNRGRGIAMGFWGNGAGPACIVANVLPDGKIGLVEGAIDIGGTRTTAAQQFAEALGIPVEDVHPQVADTDTIGFTTGAGGSSVTHKTGWAAYEAAQDVKHQLVQRAATLWETPPDEVEYADGVLRHRSDAELRITFGELAEQLNRLGGPVVGRANVNSVGAGASVAAVIVDVEVDSETGKVRVLRYTAIQDAGTAIHPGYVEGQMQGGAVQGMGWALNEEYVMGKDGHMLNTSFLDYRMPIALDVPLIDTVIVEKPNPGHPFGVRGVGESSIVPVMAAFASAIYNAVGVRMRELPMSPRAIVEAMAQKST
jgi:CO/xanthine dehydrogenase Mo-binding subunit